MRVTIMMMRKPIACVVASVCAGVMLSGCPTGGTTDEPIIDGPSVGKGDQINNIASVNSDSPPSLEGKPRLCVGVRGNGPRIFAHFAGMARVHEHYGVIDGVAGGSSGSITSFLTESIYANAQVFRCGESACDDADAGLRVALLFKSMLAYVELLAGTPEALAFQQLAPILERAQAAGVGELIAGDQFEQAGEALETILASEDLRAVVNQEALELLANSPDVRFHVSDYWATLQQFGSFAVDNDRIFVRPGLLDFGALAELFGRMGNFYAAYGPADTAAWSFFLDQCAPGSLGKGWPEIAQTATEQGSCGELFASMWTGYREALATSEPFTQRIDEPVGTHLSAMVSTSVLTGDSVAVFEEALEAYAQAQDYSWDIDFDDVQFGYWGRAEDLERMAGDPLGTGDSKTMRFKGLGSESYRRALSFSPAEPGLTRAQELGGGEVSFGGWSDLSPSLVLKGIGCEQVILVTRTGPESGFGVNVARLLGMDADDEAALYDLAGQSSARLSLEQADGVLCSDWDGLGSFAFGEVFAESYSAPLETTSEFLTTSPRAYERTEASVDKVGCTPGVGPE